jgi:glycerol-3-phosphate acyltransferase PlsY
MMSLLAIFIAYLLGSIATSVWVGQVFYNKDVREYGSGNAGATNTFRVLGVKAGIPVLLIDVLKGWLAVKLPYLIEAVPNTTDFQLVLGITAVIGHVFPVYVGFRGGKGIATLLGVLIGVHPEAAGLSMLSFLLIFLITRYVSLSSIIAAIGFPVWIVIFYREAPISLYMFAFTVAVLVVVTHKRNIERLLKGEESRANFRKKNKN